MLTAALLMTSSHVPQQEWYHGGKGRAWKCYSGLEIELLESRKEDGFALLCGGKPIPKLQLQSRLV